jgi:hypothetical protein
MARVSVLLSGALFFTGVLVLPLGTARAAETGGSASASASLDSGISAESTAPGDSDTLPGALVVGGEFGAIFPQPFTSLGTHVAFGIELGYRLPFWGQRLEIMADVGYSPPSNSFTENRTGTQYDAKVRAKELHFSLGPRFRLMDRASPWNITIAAGGRLYLLETTSNGSRGGNDFAEFKEKSTQLGGFLALGGEYVLGPGAVFLDVDFGYAKMPHEITGDASTGNLSTTLGYRFFLL